VQQPLGPEGFIDSTSNAGWLGADCANDTTASTDAQSTIRQIDNRMVLQSHALITKIRWEDLASAQEPPQIQ